MAYPEKKRGVSLQDAEKRKKERVYNETFNKNAMARYMILCTGFLKGGKKRLTGMITWLQFAGKG